MSRALPVVAAEVPRNATGQDSDGQSFASASSRQIAMSIAAGATLPFPGKSSYFYFDALSAGLEARVYKNGSPSLQNTYAQGTGLNFQPGTFDTLEIFNPNAFAVVFSVRVGFGNFIDNRSILGGAANLPVANPTYPTPGTTTTINIPDLSGSAFADINGTIWLALNRISLEVTNFATSTDLILQKAGAAVNNGPGVIGILSRTSLLLNLAGNYAISNGGGATNCIVSEIYNAIPPSFQ